MPSKNAAVCVISHAPSGFAYNGVQLDQKKGAQLPPLWTTLLTPDPEDPTSTLLELDERMARLCSQKRTTPGCGLPCAARAEKLVASAVGDRNKRTCQRLWEAIPEVYRQGHCFTDFLKVSASVIPMEQHTAVEKETGETAHVERWKNTLRQRLARFVRMTLSFSKSVLMLRPRVCSSSSIVTIESGLSCSSEPLPLFAWSATADQVSREVHPLSMTQNDLVSMRGHLLFLRSFAKILLRIPWASVSKGVLLDVCPDRHADDRQMLDLHV